jgi:hypothetical protein
LPVSPAHNYYCRACNTPLVHLERTGLRWCGRCQSVSSRAGLEPLSTSLPVLEAILGGTQLNGTQPKRRRATLPTFSANTRCAMAHLGPCNGALQRAHLLAQASFRAHPWVNHADNIAALCRSHHRAYHKAVDGRDFVTSALRDDLPPGGYGRLTLAYLEFVMTRVKPNHQRAALRIGTILEQLTAQRKWAAQPETAPGSPLERAEPLELSLYHRWLYGCGLERIADLRGALYGYNDKDYTRPGPGGEPGVCRTYRVQHNVMQSLRDPCGLEVSDTDIRALIAWWLEQSGESRALIRDRVLTERGSKPSKSTLSGWIARGAAWVSEARGHEERSHEERGATRASPIAARRTSGARGRSAGTAITRSGLDPRDAMPTREAISTRDAVPTEQAREVNNTVRLEGNGEGTQATTEALGSTALILTKRDNVVMLKVTMLYGGVLVIDPTGLAEFEAARDAQRRAGDGAAMEVRLRFSDERLDGA